jgi:hypothetical protein
MTDQEHKLCIFCRHFYYNPGEAGWSEYTPGWDMTQGCYQNVWDQDSIRDEVHYRELLQNALTCPSWQYYKEEKD